jgi:hypothetical protein
LQHVVVCVFRIRRVQRLHPHFHDIDRVRRRRRARHGDAGYAHIRNQRVFDHHKIAILQSSVQSFARAQSYWFLEQKSERWKIQTKKQEKE